MEEKIGKGIGGLVAILVLGWLAFGCISEMKGCRDEMIAAEKKYQALSKVFSPYVNYYADSARYTRAGTAVPYIKGKAIVVDCLPDGCTDQHQMPGLLQALGKKKWVELNNHITTQLPDNLIAKTVAEVGTVIQLRWGEQQIGIYREPDGANIPACRIVCSISIIDEARKAVIGGTTIVGPDPKRAARSVDSPYGLSPELQILDYIKSLPRS